MDVRRKEIETRINRVRDESILSKIKDGTVHNLFKNLLTDIEFTVIEYDKHKQALNELSTKYKELHSSATKIVEENKVLLDGYKQAKSVLDNLVSEYNRLKSAYDRLLNGEKS